MSGYTVRKEFIREFKGLRLNSRKIAITIVASYVLQVLFAIVLGYWLLQSSLSAPVTVTLVFLVLFIGTRLRGLNNIVHECSHFTFSERRKDNAILGSVCASLVLSCFADYREEHMTHHAHVGDYDKDLDLQGIKKFRLEEPLSRTTLLRFLVTPILGLHLPAYLSVNLSGRDGPIFRALKYVLIGAALLFLAFDPVPALLLVWVPYVWVYTAINFWTDCVDHGGLVGSDDELDASRNLLLPQQLSMILFPRNDCYHLVHHLFPQVPTHHLGACHKRLMTNPEYRARVERPALGDPSVKHRSKPMSQEAPRIL